MADKTVTKSLLEVLDGHRQSIPPVWLMRQAGRYLPEYREVRQKAGSILDLCFNPELAADVTLQPVKRFGFDAAILFSDILVIPYALGRRVEFLSGEGPKLDPLDDPKEIAKLARTADQNILAPVYEAIRRVKSKLQDEVTFLGFCGAPWTVATYMVAGCGTQDQIPARLLAYREPEAFAQLIDILVDASSDHLVRQFEAGVDAVQIFDTWAGVLPALEFRRWCVAPTQKIIAAVLERVPQAKIIGFPRGIGSSLTTYVDEVPVDAVGIDWMVDRMFVRHQIQTKLPVQGNLDPLVLLAGGAALDRAVDDVLESFAGGPFIFNLGHGILPETPIEHVERMLKRVRGSGK